MWVGLISLVSACQVTECFKKLLFLKEDLWNSRRFLVHTSVKYRDYKVRQRRITKCVKFKDYKVRESWITNYERFWSTKCDKNFKNWITIVQWDYKMGQAWITNCDGTSTCDGLQSDTVRHFCYRTSKLKSNNQTVIQSILSSKLFSYLYTWIFKILPK